ncbi:MAG: M28 family peptidase [Anaerolineales bacterium]|nr:M28 family peptidase [Anaerolineales bacterium]
MSHPLSAEELVKHVQALAQGVGPRPTGHAAEAVAQEYVRDILDALGFAAIEEIPFATWDTWGYATVTPNVVSLLGGVLGKLGAVGRLLSGVLSLSSSYHLLKSSDCSKQPFAFLYPNQKQTKNLLARVPAAGERLHRVVLVGHTDTNKHRQTFAPGMKRFIPLLDTLNILFPFAHGVAQVAGALGAGEKVAWLRKASALGMLVSLGLLLSDELEGYVEGANDNATAVAALLGLAAYLKEHPLQHTEVWFAFTSAEEVGCVGMHKLLDEYGHVLNNAYFIDFEMVGCQEIAYVTDHSSFSYLTGYKPDSESVRLAEKTARNHPQLGVNGRSMVIGEEVGALRGRDYRGICLAGVGDDGWLANWHQYSDHFDNIQPAGIERAARFALAMMQELDAQN